MSVALSVALSVRKNRKEVLGTNFSDPEKLDVSADELAKMHVLLDTAYRVRQASESGCYTRTTRRCVLKRG